jgi:glycosyl transferase family 25
MKAFVINLDRNPERMAHMQALLDGLGIAFERVAACDGRSLSDTELREASPDLSPGEIGCLISHRAVWEKIAETSEPYGIVFEDDVFIAPAIKRLLEKGDWIPENADIVKLETTRKRVCVDVIPAASEGSFELYGLRSAHLGSAAYIVSLGAARELLARSRKMDRPVDVYLFELPAGAAQGLVVYQADPAPCIQSDFRAGPRSAELRSDIRSERTQLRRRRRGLASRLLREVTAPFKKLGRRLSAFSESRTTWRIIASPD